ncbi:unnamed protein product, partial [marine sediment metagenome]
EFRPEFALKPVAYCSIGYGREVGRWFPFCLNASALPGTE